MPRARRLTRCPACGVAHPVEPSEAQKRASRKYEKSRRALKKARGAVADALPPA